MSNKGKKHALEAASNNPTLPKKRKTRNNLSVAQQIVQGQQQAVQGQQADQGKQRKVQGQQQTIQGKQQTVQGQQPAPVPQTNSQIKKHLADVLNRPLQTAINVSDALLPYLHLNFRPTVTSGEGAMCGLYAMVMSLQAVRNLVEKIAPGYHVSFDDAKKLFESNKYKSLVHQKLAQTGLVRGTSLYKDMRKEWMQRNFLCIQQLSMIMELVNQELGTNYYLGVVTSGNYVVEDNHGVTSLPSLYQTKLPATQQPGPIIWLYSDMPRNHWEGFTPKSKRKKNRYSSWGLDNAKSAAVQKGIYLALQDIPSTVSAPHVGLALQRGVFVYHEDWTSKTPTPKGYLWCRDSNGRVGFVCDEFLHDISHGTPRPLRSSAHDGKAGAGAAALWPSGMLQMYRKKKTGDLSKSKDLLQPILKKNNADDEVSVILQEGVVKRIPHEELELVNDPWSLGDVVYIPACEEKYDWKYDIIKAALADRKLQSTKLKYDGQVQLVFDDLAKDKNLKSVAFYLTKNILQGFDKDEVYVKKDPQTGALGEIVLLSHDSRQVKVSQKDLILLGQAWKMYKFISQPSAPKVRLEEVDNWLLKDERTFIEGLADNLGVLPTGTKHTREDLRKAIKPLLPLDQVSWEKPAWKDMLSHLEKKDLKSFVKLVGDLNLPDSHKPGQLYRDIMAVAAYQSLNVGNAGPGGIKAQTQGQPLNNRQRIIRKASSARRLTNTI